MGFEGEGLQHRDPAFEHEDTMPGDLSDTKHWESHVANQLGNAGALVERAREAARREASSDEVRARILETGARELDAAITDARRNIDEESDREHISLALEELNDQYHHLLRALEPPEKEEPEISERIRADQ